MPQLESLDDDEFDCRGAQNGTIFARISPEQKARLIKSLRRTGRSVGFLGDGVNDALALHAADVGISVDTRHRRRQGRGRRGAAGKGPGGARRGCRGGPANLRQHRSSTC